MRPLLLASALSLLLAGCGGAQNGGAEEASSLPDPLSSISGEELYRRGVLLAQGGDFVRAEQYMAASIQRGYPEEQVMPSLLAACVEASRLVAALQYAEPYLARHPDQWSLRMLVASIHMGLAHHTRARDELERVIRDAPEEPPQAHYFLGVLYRDELDDEAQADEHFQRYLALAPEGDHRDEARAGAHGASGPRLPQRVPMPEDEGADEGVDPPAPEEEAAP
ncbi:MAG: tetratricopeptide repeat protein [Myxococcales bacterium]|nr:tetratricopeptide repeat protein [Myxococcales bacterium]